MAPQGAMRIFGSLNLHPSSTLIVWLASVVLVQFLDYPGIACIVAILLLSARSCLPVWWGYVRRARWLLLTLWLILAYNTPGDAFAELPWAPTDQGMAEATRHAVRLLAMLGLLAWLFVRLGRDGLVGALWGLCLPLRRLGLDTERLAVRLSLVLDNLQRPHARGEWRKILQAAAPVAEGPSHVRIDLPPWRAADSLLLVIVVLIFCGAMLT